MLLCLLLALPSFAAAAGSAGSKRRARGPLDGWVWARHFSSDPSDDESAASAAPSGLTIGLVVGGVVIAVAIILAIVVVVIRRRRAQAEAADLWARE
jgi:heme/copper-type cytochrome/quinol oxidase subunit 2